MQLNPNRVVLYMYIMLGFEPVRTRADIEVAITDSRRLMLMHSTLAIRALRKLIVRLDRKSVV